MPAHKSPLPRVLPDGHAAPSWDALRETRRRPTETRFVTRLSRRGLPCVENDANLARDNQGNLVGQWVRVKSGEALQRERRLFPERFRVTDYDDYDEVDDVPPALHSLKK